MQGAAAQSNRNTKYKRIREGRSIQASTDMHLVGLGHSAHRSASDSLSGDSRIAECSHLTSVSISLTGDIPHPCPGRITPCYQSVTEQCAWQRGNFCFSDERPCVTPCPSMDVFDLCLIFSPSRCPAPRFLVCAPLDSVPVSLPQSERQRLDGPPTVTCKHGHGY